jgi:hypothetical protein
LDHVFRGFSFRPWLASAIAFRSVSRQKHHGGKALWRKAAHFRQPGGNKKEQEGSRTKIYPSKTFLL